jgi:hypothetical protein
LAGLPEEPDDIDLKMLSSVDRGDAATIPHELVKMIALDKLSPVAAWRKYRGFNLSEAANHLNIDPSVLSDMEDLAVSLKGETKREMAALYQCRVEDLL